MRTLALILVSFLAWSAVAAAQPIPTATDPTSDPRTTGEGDTKIPVTLGGATEVMGAETTASSAGAAPVPLEQPIDPDHYTCGPGDVFEVNFWGKQNFRLRVAADLEGRVFISKVGFVAVGGKTLTAVRQAVNKKIRAIYPGLSFELTLVSPRSFLVHVIENVKSPGAVTASPLERVSSVLAHAGGVTGSRRQISIRRKSGEEVTADLLLYERTGDTKFNPYVLDGDVIRVPFSEVNVTIGGAVHRPGTYELVKTKDFAELLELAGGFTSSVTKRLPIRVIRRDVQQHDTFEEHPFANGATPNIALRDEDRVLVRGASEFERSILLIGAVAGADSLDPAATSRRLSYVEGDTILSLLDRAGGVKPSGDLKHAYISRPQRSGPPKLISVDLEALLVRRDFSADKPVLLNDTIVVPQIQHSILVEGAVARGGMYPYNPLFKIPEYIARAGGRTRTAVSMDDVKLIDSDGKTHDFREGLVPSPGDSILVPERSFTRAEIVQLVLAGAGLALSGVAIGIAATR